MNMPAGSVQALGGGWSPADLAAARPPPAPSRPESEVPPYTRVSGVHHLPGHDCRRPPTLGPGTRSRSESPSPEKTGRKKQGARAGWAGVGATRQGACGRCPVDPGLGRVGDKGPQDTRRPGGRWREREVEPVRSCCVGHRPCVWTSLLPDQHLEVQDPGPPTPQRARAGWGDVWVLASLHQVGRSSPLSAKRGHQLHPHLPPSFLQMAAAGGPYQGEANRKQGVAKHPHWGGGRGTGWENQEPQAHTLRLGPASCPGGIPASPTPASRAAPRKAPAMLGLCSHGQQPLAFSRPPARASDPASWRSGWQPPDPQGHLPARAVLRLPGVGLALGLRSPSSHPCQDRCQPGWERLGDPGGRPRACPCLSGLRPLMRHSGSWGAWTRPWPPAWSHNPSILQRDTPAKVRERGGRRKRRGGRGPPCLGTQRQSGAGAEATT